MIPRIVLEPSLLWFLYVAPNKEFFVLVHSGPLWSTVVHCGVCVFIKLFIFPTPWLGPGPGQSSRLIVLQDWRLGENKNSNKTNINLISESPQAPGSVYQCLDFVHWHWQPMTVLCSPSSEICILWIPRSLSLSVSLSLYLDLTITTLPQRTTRYRHSYLVVCLTETWLRPQSRF